MWTFKVPAGTPKAQLVETINATAHTYEGIPGLIRKYYGIAPDGASIVGIYLWANKAAADTFYSADWQALVTKRWGTPPQRQEWETPMVVESLLPNLKERIWFKAGEILLLVTNQYDHCRGRLDIEYMFITDGRTEVRHGTHRAYTYRQLVELMEGAGFAVTSDGGWTRASPVLTLVGTRVG